jgi:alpha-galactosidase
MFDATRIRRIEWDANVFTREVLVQLIRCLLTTVLLTPLILSAQTAKLAATPPMGWNSWNYFAEKVDDKAVRDAADALVSTGMRDAGYIYVNIDDTWQGERDAQGVLHANNKFPDMKALADYVHSKGLKIGIYSGPGPQTCAGYAGSYQHEDQDAKMYAEWGMDYLKYDLCSFRTDVMDKQAPDDFEKQMALMHGAYATMQKALLKTGRPIVYSFCQYGWDAVWAWGPKLGANLWRTTGDISPNYDRMSVIGFAQAGLSKFAGPGHWNDPDMLEVGNGKMTPDENRTHMTLWAMLAAPLLAGNDLSNMKPETLAILMNKDVVAIDQDPLGVQGDRVYAEGPVEIWTKPLKDGSKAVAIFNRGDRRSNEYPVTLRFKDIGVTGPAKARDVWADKSLGTISDGMKFKPLTHGVILLKISK